MCDLCAAVARGHDRSAVRKDAKSLAQRGTPPRSCLGAQGDELAPAPAGGSAVSIELSTTQVDQVIRSASGGSRFSAMLSGLLDAREALRASLEDLDDRRLSRSLLSGLFMFASFPRDGSYLGNLIDARTPEALFQKKLFGRVKDSPFHVAGKVLRGSAGTRA